MHSNKLVLFGISKLHDIARKRMTVKYVNFNVKGRNALDMKVSGKRKNGAQVMEANTIVCEIHTCLLYTSPSPRDS